KGKMTVNEQRKRLDLPPVEGGNTVYLQEQDHSLEWLARRDAEPIASPEPAPVEPDDDSEQRMIEAIAGAMQRAVEPVAARVEALEASNAEQRDAIASMPDELLRRLPVPVEDEADPTDD